MPIDCVDQHLHCQGFAVVPHVLDETECDAIAWHLDALALTGAGSRTLLSEPWCAEIAERLRQHQIVGAILQPGALAVQCTLFDKSSGKNWGVALHQDLSIPVRDRVANTDCSGWSEKEGRLYVQPPMAALADLVAVRIHVDPCPPESGALRVIPGSHILGRLDATQAERLRTDRGEHVVPVPRGGALAMRPLLLHASSKATNPAPRRVLHFVFGPPTLPAGLTWHQSV